MLSLCLLNDCGTSASSVCGIPGSVACVLRSGDHRPGINAPQASGLSLLPRRPAQDLAYLPQQLLPREHGTGSSGTLCPFQQCDPIFSVKRKQKC